MSMKMAEIRKKNPEKKEKTVGRELNRQELSFEDATGDVKYNMTNDFMFHYVLQENEYALKGLIASLLHLDAGDIESVRVENPILIGRAVSSKEYVLDILVSLNNHEMINMEMQVEDLKNWTERSLAYTCREFGRLNHGEDYSKVRPVYHIGFLDYTLFPEHPEFYARYRLRNVKDGYLYSDKINVGVVELNHIDLATEEDKKYGIDNWVRLFKAKTWEDLKMLAQENTYIKSAAQTMFAGNISDEILELCRRRDEELEGEALRRRLVVEQAAKIEEQEAKLKVQSTQLESQAAQLESQEERIKSQTSQIDMLKEQSREKDERIEKQGVEIKELGSIVSELKAELDRIKKDINL